MRLFKLMDVAFDRYDDSVRKYLQKTFTSLGLQYTHSQVFGVIFDGLKGMLENMLFYIEDAMTEQNVFKATRKQSVYSLAKLSGYEPYYGSAAVGTLLGKMFVTNGLESKMSKIYISNYTEVFNKTNGMTYSIVLPTEYYVFDVTKPLVNHEFKIVQGTLEVGTYTAKGTNFETFEMTCSGSFDRQYLEVLVDNVKWSEAANMYDMTYKSEEYILKIGFDSTFEITFGNDIYGKRLEEGQTIVVKYLSHMGTYGNILPDESSDFKFSSKGFDALGNAIDVNNYMSLQMTGCVTGGTNSDSIQTIRQMIGYNSRSLVYASEDNFKLFFKRFSFIGYVNCWSEKNSMCVTATCLRDIKDEIYDADTYYAFDTKKLLLTDNQKEMIIETLKNSNRAFAGVTLKFQDPVIRKFAVICYVKADNVYNRELIKNSINVSLANYFLGTFEDVQFIAKSDLLKKIMNDCSNIKAIDLDIISELGENTYRDGYYDRYELRFVNDSYQYVTRRVIYEKNTTPGLDGFGNISLESKLEIPILHGGFNYYPDKDSFSKDAITLDAVQIYFI